MLANSEAANVDGLGLTLIGPTRTHQVVAVDPAIYDQYTGKYKLGPGAIFTIRREGDRLFAELTGQEKYEIFPQSQTDFFYKVVDAQLTFHKDQDGKVTYLILHQNGVDQKAARQ